MTTKEIRVAVAIFAQQGIYPSRVKIQKALRVLYGHGIDNNRIRTVLQALRDELGISSRGHRPRAQGHTAMRLPAPRGAAPPQAAQTTMTTVSPAPVLTSHDGQAHGQPPIRQSHPALCPQCGGADWARFGTTERGWPAFVSEWSQCLDCRTVSIPQRPPVNRHACRPAAASAAEISAFSRSAMGSTSASGVEYAMLPLRQVNPATGHERHAGACESGVQRGPRAEAC
jgi:hypothetical protein